MGWEQTKMRQNEEMTILNFDLKSAKMFFFCISIQLIFRYFYWYAYEE